LVENAVPSFPWKARKTTTGKMAKKERKKTIWPAGTAPAALMQDDMPTKTATDTILSMIPVSVLCPPGWSLGFT
jgi:hypothetical protein